MHVFGVFSAHCPSPTAQGSRMVPAVPLQGFPACRVLVAGSIGVLRTGYSGMLMVQGTLRIVVAGSTGMFVTLGCSDCRRGRIMAQGIPCGVSFPRTRDGMRGCDTGPAESSVFPRRCISSYRSVCRPSQQQSLASGGALLCLPWVDKTGGGVTAKKSSLEPDSRVRARAGLSEGQDSKGYLGISFRSQTQASACHCFPRSAPEGFCVCRSRRSPGCPCSTELSV